MWVYMAVLVGVTVVVIAQLALLRKHRHPGISPEALQAAADARQALVDDALGRVGPVGEGLRVGHSTEYSWPHFTVHLPSQEALTALEASGGVEALRLAFAEAVAAGGGEAVEGSAFDPELGVEFRVAGESLD